MSKIWRDEEGERAREPAKEGAPALGSLWRPDEGTVAEASPQRSETMTGLWDESDSPVAEPVAEPEARRERRSEPRPAPKRRGMKVAITLTFVVLVLALVADLAYSTVSTGLALRNVAAELDKTRDALQAGNLEGARRASAEALAEARRAESFTGHPGFWVAKLLPDGDVLAGVSDAAVLAARAGTAGTKAAEEMGVTGEGVASSVYSDGRVEFDALAAAEGSIQEASRLLETARGRIEDLPEPLIDALSVELADAREQVGSAADAATKGRALVGVLPTMLGQDSSKSYLLAFQASGEARATGGLIGFLGTLEANNGRLKLSGLSAIGEAFKARFEDPVEAPAWFADSYGPQTALRQVQQVNVSPNFPVVSEILLNMHEELTGRRHDGVIAMDPMALAHMMEGMDPIEIDGRSVTSDNVVDILLHDSYLELETTEQNRFIEMLIGRFWNRVRSGNIQETKFVAGLNDAAAGQHFKVYSEDADSQVSMQQLEASGDYQAGPNVQIVFSNNYSANKIDYFMHRRIDTVMELRESQPAEVRTTVTLENRSPAGPPSLLIGEGGPDRDPPGTNTMLLSVLLPEGAVVRGVVNGGEIEEAATYVDAGSPVVWDIIEIPAGKTREMTVVYELGAGTRGRSGNLEMTLFPQATVNPDLYSLTVRAPNGSSIRQAADPTASGSSSVTVDGVLEVPRIFGFEVLGQ